MKKWVKYRLVELLIVLHAVDEISWVGNFIILPSQGLGVDARDEGKKPS
jgi:hypothetical protein